MILWLGIAIIVLSVPMLALGLLLLWWNRYPCRSSEAGTRIAKRVRTMDARQAHLYGLHGTPVRSRHWRRVELDPYFSCETEGMPCKGELR